MISLSLFTPDIDLFDLNRVETLRGPQGTLFGSGSVGGTIRYITNQPQLGRFEGLAEANVNLVDEDDIGGHLKGMVNLPIGDQVAVRAVGYYTQYGGFIDALREGGGVDEDVNDGHRVGGRLAITLEPVPGIRLTRASSTRRSAPTASTGRRSTASSPIRSRRLGPPSPSTSASSSCCSGKAFPDDTLLADFTVQVDLTDELLTSISTYIDREIVVSRDASALTGSVSVDLGFPAAAVLLPSNLIDTTDLSTFAQECGCRPTPRPVQLRRRHLLRQHRPLLSPAPAHPGLRRRHRRSLRRRHVGRGGERRAPPDSPYNADLPYDIRQTAVFGEATYDISDRLIVTAGGRWYDFSEEQRFFRRPVLERRRPHRRDLVERLQPALHPQLGGARQHPLQRPGLEGLPARRRQRSAQLAALHGPGRGDLRLVPGYDDETLWNYEVGVRGQRRASASTPRPSIPTSATSR